MTFAKGQSGNVKGRPPRTDTERRQRDAIRKALPGIIERLIGQATVDGDTVAAKLLLERVMPAWKPVDRPVSLTLGNDLSAASVAVLAALGAGTLTPDQAATLAGTIGSLARTSELIEVEKRLTEIESLLHEHKNRSQN